MIYTRYRATTGNHMAAQLQIPIMTKAGLIALGQLLEHSRKRLGWSQDELLSQIKARTGCTISKSAISALERGNSKPGWDTLSILAATNYVQNPTNKPYTTTELFMIACERADYLSLYSPSKAAEASVAYTSQPA